MNTKHCTRCGFAGPKEALFCSQCGNPLHRGDQDPLIGQTIAGRYHLVERIGQGGAGTLYRAEHTALRRRMAIKLLHQQLSSNEEAVERFRREAITVCEIDNDHILQVHDFGKAEDGRLFFAMEYLDGEPLSAVLEREGALSVERTCDILGQLADGLMEAHALGYVHRDLRPRNIFLTKRRGKSDFVKLLDFGLAKLIQPDVDAAKTTMGMTFGDPHYMAPEQARGEVVDRRADIYSLGATAFEMLAGRPPYKGAGTFDVLSKVMDAPVPRVKDLRPDCPEWLESVVRTALAKSPADRFATVALLLEALERKHVLEHQPPVSLHVSAPRDKLAAISPLGPAQVQALQAQAQQAVPTHVEREAPQAPRSAEREAPRSEDAPAEGKQPARRERRPQEHERKATRLEIKLNNQGASAEPPAAARLKAEHEARLKAALEAQLQAEQETRVKAEVEERLRAEVEARLKVEQEARLKAEVEARFQAEQDARIKAEQEARVKAEREARVKAEKEAFLKAEQEARVKAEQEARVKADQEARVKAEREARLKAEKEALRVKAEQEAQARAEQEARAKAEQEARQRAEQEARAKAEQEARERAEQEARVKAEQEARVKAEQEAQARAEQEARVKQETQAKPEQSVRIRMEQASRLKAEQDIERKAREASERAREAAARILQQARHSPSSMTPPRVAPEVVEEAITKEKSEREAVAREAAAWEAAAQEILSPAEQQTLIESPEEHKTLIESPEEHKTLIENPTAEVMAQREAALAAAAVAQSTAAVLAAPEAQTLMAVVPPQAVVPAEPAPIVVASDKAERKQATPSLEVRNREGRSPKVTGENESQWFNADVTAPPPSSALPAYAVDDGEYGSGIRQRFSTSTIAGFAVGGVAAVVVATLIIISFLSKPPEQGPPGQAVSGQHNVPAPVAAKPPGVTPPPPSVTSPPPSVTPPPPSVTPPPAVSAAPPTRVTPPPTVTPPVATPPTKQEPKQQVAMQDTRPKPQAVPLPVKPPAPVAETPKPKVVPPPAAPVAPPKPEPKAEPKHPVVQKEATPVHKAEPKHQPVKETPKQQAPKAEPASGEEVAKLLQDGHAKLQNGDVGGAAASFGKAHELDGRSAEAVAGLGEVAFEQGNWDDAVRHLRKAVGQAPRKTSYKVLLGQSLYKSGHYKDAAEVCRQVLKQDSSSREAQQTLEMAERKLGE